MIAGNSHRHEPVAKEKAVPAESGFESILPGTQISFYCPRGHPASAGSAARRGTWLRRGHPQAV